MLAAVKNPMRMRLWPLSRGESTALFNAARRGNLRAFGSIRMAPFLVACLIFQAT